MRPEVLIAGAGPSGLSLAITLRRFGIPVRIIDRAAQPSAVSKALAVWSGSLEALQGMQVIDEFVAAGKRLRALSVGDGSRTLAVLAVGDGIDSPYPYPLLLPQSRTEQILAARLAALGVEIERRVELVGLAQDGDGVTAELRHADNEIEKIRVPYLAGCDGARSLVRQSLAIAYEGYTEPETFLLGDVQIDGGQLDHRSIYLWWHNGGTVALFPFENALWRVFAMRGMNGGDAAPTIEELQRRIDLHGPRGLRLRDPTWLSAFHINERLAMTQDVLRTRPAAEWLERLTAEGVPCAPVLTRGRMIQHPQVQANGIVVETEHRAAGRLRQARPAARFSATPTAIRRGGPALGEHTGEVLAELGYSDAEIAALRAEGIDA